MQSVQRRMACFCVYPDVDKALAANQHRSFGKEALDRFYAELLIEPMDFEPAREKEITFADLRPLHVFNWLLTEDQQKLTAKTTDALLKDLAIVSVPKDVVIPDDAKKAKAKRVSKAKAPVDIVESYFS